MEYVRLLGAEGGRVVDATWVPALRTVHVVAVIVFIVAHAMNMIVGFRLKGVRDAAAARRMLDGSRTALLVAYLALIVVLVAGILGGIAGAWFTSGRLWIWAALIVLVAVFLLMGFTAGETLARLRWAVGAKPTRGEKQPLKWYGDRKPTDEDFRATLAAWNPWLTAAIGLVGLVVLFWLMYAKPF
jgi:hypothetical protein